MISNERLLQRAAGIEEFLRVAETLSFARAAERLGQSASATSKTVSRLENRLGVRLFHRTTRSVRLTGEGAALYERASRWAADLEEMQSALSSDADLVGRIRLEIPVSIGRAMVMPHLGRFMVDHPRLRIEVGMNDRRVDLVAEGVDLALRVGEMPDSELMMRPLGRIRQGTYISPEMLARDGRPEGPDALVGRRLVAFLPGPGRWRPMCYHYAGETSEIDTQDAVAGFTNGEALIDAAAAGIGIAQSPAVYAEQALAAGRLVQIFEGLDAPGVPVQLVYPSRRQMPRRVRALIDFLIATWERQQTGGGALSP